MKKINLLIFAMICCFAAQGASMRIDDLGINTFSPREYSYSDKSAGFYYGMTNTDSFTDFYAGWNIEAHRIFADYSISVDGKTLSKADAQTKVFPDRIVRKYKDSQTTETFRLVDGKKIIFIDIEAPEGAKTEIALSGENLGNATGANGAAEYAVKNFADKSLRITAADGGFVITFGTTAENDALQAEAKLSKEQMLNDRRTRMQALLDRNQTDDGNGSLKEALPWLMLTADELVTYQHGGWGIYAGFPWFTDFWGRDMFIAMPGTTLCTGQFDIAKNILASFAKYMDTDPKSPTYGRVPNRLNLEGILYNTTDGTPRFVLQVYDYLKYTGDKAFIKAIYKNIKIATDASIEKYADENGYLTHEDADTWMDAKRQGLRPCSPRGNRAVDIQALWYAQLETSALLADYMGKKSDAANWRAVADKLKTNFEKDFICNGIITDHLNADNSRDNQLRPNTMFAYELIGSDSVKMQDIKTLWSRLVYPWGVSSLDQMDDDFHPYHEQWHRYHKDDAYHNGTVWLWQNGMAMQRMIEYGQKNAAFRLFKNMNNQALNQGAVGSLSECADAWCRPGKTGSRRTGTFLQSWSNSEQIRVWSQYFLGIRPNMLNNEITIAPRLPLRQIFTKVQIADGEICYEAKPGNFYQIEWTGSAATTFRFDLEKWQDFAVTLNKGERIIIESLRSANPTAMVYSADNKIVKTISLKADPDKIAFEKECAEYFEDIDFAEPCYRENIKAMSRYFDPPLDYYSAE